MASAVKEERRYSLAERQLATSGKTLDSELLSVEGAVADAFAGKDSKAVKTAMKVGTFLEQARERQHEATRISEKEATRTEKEAAAQAAVLAQTSEQSKLLQEQRAYTSGMAQLARDGKAVLSRFTMVRGAVAQAFAGKDSKGVETAMELGELLDRARENQQKVTDGDMREARDAPRFFRRVSATALPSAKVRIGALLQHESQSNLAAAQKASRAMRLRGQASSEKHVLDETNKVEGMIKHELDAAKLHAIDGGRAADSAEQRVLAAIESAKKAEKKAYAITEDAVRMTGVRM